MSYADDVGRTETREEVLDARLGEGLAPTRDPTGAVRLTSDARLA